MNQQYKYSRIESSKDGKLIPLCKRNLDGAEFSLHSKYNPLREAESFAQNVDESSLFIIVLGLAGAYHIKAILDKCPKCKIIAVEISARDIDFLKTIPMVKEVAENKRVIISDESSLEKAILSNYKPALHGNLKILSLRQWENLFADCAERCREKIMAAIKLLSADYSVQCHFGKIWQKNILTNLSLAAKTKSFGEIQKNINTDKKAAIIAAGPSLDDSAERLKVRRNDYFIIATDTAFSALLKRGIKSDCIISIDGQAVSHEHYMEKIPESTICVFDLCACPSAVRKALSESKSVLLTESGHPLSQYASLFQKKRNFPHINSGSGTVTIAGASLAKKMGFKQIEFFGADFAYIAGRPYCQGTYLENKFYSKSDRLSSAEKFYTALMYRTEVIKTDEKSISTEILEAYRNSLKDFMSKEECEENIEEGHFNLSEFKKSYIKELKSAFPSEGNIDENSYAMTTLLPLCAKMGKGSAFLAYLKTLSYTERV